MKQFEWTDELAYEFAAKWKDGRLGDRLPIAIEEFKQSKQPKPEWKVISLQTENDTFNLHLNRMYKSGDVEFGLEHLLNVEKAQITTVQRLSDGEIFSVGNAIKWKITGGIFSSTIQGFELEYLDMMICVENNSRVNLCVIQKAKQPLFTTEDGVPIYEGGEIWYVDDRWHVDVSNAFHTTNALNWKIFSTEAAAEAYVLANKPQLSLSDVEQAYVGDKKSKEYISLIDNLRLIIRQKK